MSTFQPYYGYTSYSDAAAESSDWTAAEAALKNNAFYGVDEAGWVYKLVWTRDMSLPDVTVVWSPLSRKEISAKVTDQPAIRNLVVQLYENGKKVPTGLDSETGKDEAIAYAKAKVAYQKSGGGKKSAPDTSLTTSGGGGRMTTSGDRRGGGGSTPFYKNPWVIGGTAVAVLGAVLIFALRGKGKTS